MGDIVQFVYVPVPASQYGEVLTLLKRRATGSIDGRSEELATRINTLCREVGVNSRKMMILLARNPERWVSKAELADRLGITHDKVRGALAGLSRISKRLLKEDYWPFHVRVNADRLAEYRMDAEEAALVLKACSEEEA